MTGGDIKDYLIKHARDRALEIRIAHKAMSAIGVEVMRGLGVTRRRGAEVGGLLLGLFDRNILVVEEIEIIPCEYAYGPSWLLSDADSARLIEAIARWRSARGTGKSVVGWFRSHTREGLQPDAPDTGLLHTHFAGAPAALLLIKPYATRDSDAAVYLGADGRMDAEPAIEFTFAASPHSDVRHGHPPEPHTARRRHVSEPDPARPSAELRRPTDKPQAAPERTPDEAPRLPGRTLFHRASGEPPVAEPPVRTALPVEPVVPGIGGPQPAPPSSPLYPPVRDSASVPAPERMSVGAPQRASGPSAAPEPTPAILPKVVTEKERILQDVLGKREPESGSGRSGTAYRDLFADYGAKPPSAPARIAAWAAFTLAAVLFGGIVGYRAAGGNVAALLEGAAGSQPGGGAYDLGLTTGLRGDSILIRWDRRSEAVHAGLRGMVVIASPAGRQEIRLEPEELRHGVVLYKTAATEAEIRLEVFLTPSRLIAEQTVWKRQAFVEE